MNKKKQALQLSINSIRILKIMANGQNKIIPEYFNNGSHRFYIMDGDIKYSVYKKTIANLEHLELIKKAQKLKGDLYKYEITKAGIEIIPNKSTHGGARPNSGVKNPNRPVYMYLWIPVEDKVKIKAKFGRGFNEVFRQWVKALIGDK